MTDESPKPILIFSHETSIGNWEITTAPSTFDIMPLMEGISYQLSFGEWTWSFGDIYEAICAVAEHRTGLDDWDNSDEEVSDDALDWRLHLDKRFQMQLLAEYLRFQPSDPMSRLVEYFESKHSYFMDRMEVYELFVELITTGQIETLPSMFCAPSELKGLERIAKVWGIPIDGASDSP